MKKWLALILMVAALMTLCAFALAEGELQLVEDSYCIFEGKDNKYTAYLYCIFENVSDKPVEVKKCEVNVTDADGNPFLEKAAAISGSDFHPATIHPGERTYVRKEITCKEVTDASKISNYVMTMETRDSNHAYLLAESEPVYSYKLNSKGDAITTSIAMKITNTSDAPHDQLNMMTILRDQNGKLIYCNNDTSGRLTLYPGSTIEYIVSSVPGDLTRVWIANGIEPVTAETICFFVVK
ncbi:MAG: hypothetical protein MJ136_06300 [Clostridia bacterium]|nr:hypothetical protein [Clostridia bacterium]